MAGSWCPASERDSAHHGKEAAFSGVWSMCMNECGLEDTRLSLLFNAFCGPTPQISSPCASVSPSPFSYQFTRGALQEYQLLLSLFTACTQHRLRQTKLRGKGASR